MDLVLLQEANPNSLDLLRVSAGMDWAVTAFDGGAPFHTGRSGRRRVAALAGKGEPPHDVGILPDLALPERFVYASVLTTEGPMTIASYHAPPGVSWGMVKVEHAHALLNWINSTPGPLIVGADANTPQIDHPDLQREIEQDRPDDPLAIRQMRRCDLDEVFYLGGWAAGARSNRLRGLGSQWLSAQPPRGAPATKRASGYHLCVNTTRVGHSDPA